MFIIGNEKVRAPQSKGGQELKKQITEHYKGCPKHPKSSFYVAQRWLEEFIIQNE